MREKVMEIIFWCDAHDGFISVILSIFTILISILALVISSQISRTPYKKRIAVSPCYYEENGEPIIDTLIVNYGLTALVIDSISLMDEKRTNVGGTPGLNPIVIKPSESETFHFHISDWNGLIRKNSMNLNKHLIIAVYEYGGKKRIFKKGFPQG
jgi:hypothetical protein